MSNIVKGAYTSVDAEAKRVINSNRMIADRIELLEMRLREQGPGEDEYTDEFTEGLDAQMVDSLLADPDADPDDPSANVIKAEQPAPAVDLEAVNAEAEQILEDARNEAENILQQAMDEAEARKESVYAEAREAGRSEGYEAGMAEVETLKAELAEKEEAMMAEFEQMVQDLEPMLVDKLSDIYGHIFNVDLAEKKEVILYLLQGALQSTDTTSGIMIHVAKDDYEFISGNKDLLFEGIPGADACEIVPDITLGAGQAMIDTGSGIFDCSVGTELAGLKKQLKLLSYQSTDIPAE